MNRKFLINKEIIKESWYFLSALLIVILILELYSPGLVLLYINPLFIFVLWLILVIYLLYQA